MTSAFHTIYWRGEVIGYLHEPQWDMWYVDGRWEVIDNETTRAFLALTQHRTYDDWKNINKLDDLIWVGFDQNTPNYVFVVFLEGRLLLRMVTQITPPTDW